ncbi:helix-turn-helix transcriptional regulator [Sphingosinicella xenopeptidilytica]|uniref:LuxR C-terminal-related transcriptional regulator n=1 Tax=Sphingosinicella xenopeptidilytica TaxID=364098 RepID=A0ABW3C7Z0_SPHXN
MLFWFGENNRLEAPRSLAMSQGLLPFYDEHVGTHDPLNLLSLSEARSEVRSLRQDVRMIKELHPAYLAYLTRFQIHDELDMVFWYGERPAAGLALFRTMGCQEFLIDQNCWDNIHHHFDCVLQAHDRLREIKLQHFSHRYGLTVSEVSVVRAMMAGASNHEIVDLLELKLSTVKSYIFSIFNKMGVENRTAAVALLYQALLR